MEVYIRSGSIRDIASISLVARRTWPIAYQNVITPAQVEYMLDLMYSEMALSDQFTRLGHSFFLAFSDDEPIGFSSISHHEDKTFKLHKLYVLPENKGTGIGKKLLWRSIEEARKQGAEELILQVNRKNPSIQFYSSQGFTIQDEKVFEIGQGFQMDDFIMAKKLLV